MNRPQRLSKKTYFPMMKYLLLFTLQALLLHHDPAISQVSPARKGKLFIIGGGDRPPTLMQSLVTTAGLNAGDYAVVLPMSSESPDTSFYYFKTDLAAVWPHAIVNFNFTPAQRNNKAWLDSLAKAKLIFITGGDQERFMKAVLKTPVYDAIHAAFERGGTVAGTSAGAAVMSKYMITGKALKDTSYHATFTRLQQDNLEITEGLGLLGPVIVDQHFIVRSRYNRLLSALARYPSYSCIGIDEATAIIVQARKVTVAGRGQVIVVQNPVDMKITSTGLIKVKDLQFSIYTSGDEFRINESR